VNRRRHLRAVLLFLMLLPLAVGCVRVHTSLTVSTDDRVSGQIVAAAKAKNSDDKGPQLTNSLPFASKVAVSDYRKDDYVGSEAVFSDLTFSEVPQLANLSRDSAGADISLRRAGDLVILEGRVDLTTLSDPDADVTLSVAFPGDVTSTNGERVASDTDPSARSFTTAAIWMAILAFAVAAVIGGLAYWSRDRSSKFAAVSDE
jgi:hypothetical protein